MVLGRVVHGVREDAHGRGAALGKKGLEPKLKLGLLLEVECVDLPSQDSADGTIVNGRVQDLTERMCAHLLQLSLKLEEERGLVSLEAVPSIVILTQGRVQRRLFR